MTWSLPLATRCWAKNARGMEAEGLYAVLTMQAALGSSAQRNARLMGQSGLQLTLRMFLKNPLSEATLMQPINPSTMYCAQSPY